MPDLDQTVSHGHRDLPYDTVSSHANLDTRERPFSSYLTRFEHAIIQSLPTFGPPIWKKKKKEKMSNCGRIEIVYKKEKKIGGNSAKKKDH